VSIQLRQICLVAHSLNAAISDLQAVLGIKSCFVDRAVEKWGLENNLLCIGNNFLEVVSPTQSGTTAGRFLQRRGGDGGYMVICQADNHDNQLAVKERAIEAGVRIAWERKNTHYHLMQLHPADMQAAFLEVDWDKHNDFDGNWEPAGGSGWVKHISQFRCLGFCGVELQCNNPEQITNKWAKVLGIKPEAYEIELNNALLRFVPVRDERGPGICGIDVVVRNKDAVFAAAKKRELVYTSVYVEICGVRFYPKIASTTP